jgi:hypothetical protein
MGCDVHMHPPSQELPFLKTSSLSTCRSDGRCAGQLSPAGTPYGLGVCGACHCRSPISKGTARSIAPKWKDDSPQQTFCQCLILPPPSSTLINLIYFVPDYLFISSIMITVCRDSRLYTALDQSQNAEWFINFLPFQDSQAPRRGVGRERKFKFTVASTLVKVV